MNTDPGSIVAAVWWLSVVAVGGVIAARPVDQPPRHRVRKAVGFAPHWVRHAVARRYFRRR